MTLGDRLLVGPVMHHVTHGSTEGQVMVTAGGTARRRETAAHLQATRERQLAAFARTAAAVAQEPRLDVVLDRLADEVRAATGLRTCAIVITDDPPGEFRYAGQSGLPVSYIDRLEACRRNGAFMVTGEAARTGRPQVLRQTREHIFADPRWEPARDLLADEPWDAFIAVPMAVHGRVVGVLNGLHEVGYEPDDALLRFLAAMADHAAIAIDHSRMYRQLQLKAAEEERQRLARDMHDSVTQALFSLTLRARSLELTRQDHPDPTLLAELTEMRELAQSALIEMRALIQHRRPAELHEQGLAAGLRQHLAAFATTSGISADLACDDDPLLDQNLEEDLFRIVQEALNNVTKHSFAHHVQVELRPADDEPDALLVRIVDDGIGISDTASGTGTGTGDHFGMATMHDRAHRHGATLSVTHGQRDTGTCVQIRVPGALAPGRLS